MSIPICIIFLFRRPVMSATNVVIIEIMCLVNTAPSPIQKKGKEKEMYVNVYKNKCRAK